MRFEGLIYKDYKYCLQKLQILSTKTITTIYKDYKYYL